MTLRRQLLISCALITAGLTFASGIAGAQVLQMVNNIPVPAGTVPDSATPAVVKPTASLAASPATATAAPSAVRASMLDEPASAAKVELNGNRLVVDASNSSLSEVLRQVATRTGMQIDGNSRDQRVFGVYGPGTPQEVLTALLYDSGYNVMMVGRTEDGAPRRLVLSARGVANASSQVVSQPRRNDDDDDDSPPPEPPPQQPIAQPAQMTGPTIPGQAKTPQQMLEELQRMHQGEQAPETPH